MPPHRTPNTRRQRLRRLGLCALLLAQLALGLLTPLGRTPAGAGARHTSAAPWVMVCTAAGMRQLLLPADDAATATEAADGHTDPAHPPSGHDLPAAGHCVLCHARHALALTPLAPATPLVARSSLPRAPAHRGPPLAAPTPWPPQQTRGPPAIG